LLSAFWNANNSNAAGSSKKLGLTFAMLRTYMVTKEGFSFPDLQASEKYLLPRTDVYSLTVLNALFTGMRLGEVRTL